MHHVVHRERGFDSQWQTDLFQEETNEEERRRNYQSNPGKICSTMSPTRQTVGIGRGRGREILPLEAHFKLVQETAAHHQTVNHGPLCLPREIHLEFRDAIDLVPPAHRRGLASRCKAYPNFDSAEVGVVDF